jgi:hypothetical protein
MRGKYKLVKWKEGDFGAQRAAGLENSRKICRGWESRCVVNEAFKIVGERFWG